VASTAAEASRPNFASARHMDLGVEASILALAEARMSRLRKCYEAEVEINISTSTSASGSRPRSRFYLLYINVI